MLRDEFPDLKEPDMEDRSMEAALALELELQYELDGRDVGGLHMARIKTDLLIP